MSYSHNCLFIGKVLIKKEELDSTNNYAKELLSNSKPIEGTAIFTDFQHSGRGQKENIWQSNAKENIATSIILYPQLEVEQFFLLNQAIAIGLRDSIANFLPHETVEIKWPNDILVNQKKIAGLLVENNLSANKIISSIIGVGVNVNQETFKDGVIALSMKLLLHKDIVLDDVLQSIFSSIEHAYLMFKRNIPFIKSTYHQYLYGYKKNIEIIHLETDIHLNGQIEGIQDNGMLQFTTTSNKAYLFNFKEIKFCL